MEYTLSNGDVVEIRDRSTLTERLSRPVSIAQTRSVPVSQKLLSKGFNEADATTWGPMYDLSPDEWERLWAYKTAVIAAMVVKWPWPLDISEEGAGNVHPDVFEELASVCNLAFRGESFEIDPDPKVDTSASTD